MLQSQKQLVVTFGKKACGTSRTKKTWRIIFTQQVHPMKFMLSSVPRTGRCQSTGITKTDIQFFTPGVDLDDPFIQTVNKHISNWNTTPVIPINNT
jgi:hypothetical protein